MLFPLKTTLLNVNVINAIIPSSWLMKVLCWIFKYDLNDGLKYPEYKLITTASTGVIPI
jgi:hypothetical protein